MLVLSLLILTAGLALAYEEYDIDQAEGLFEQFIQDYSRVYKDDQEKQMRLNIFKENLLEINEQNRLHGYNVLGINKFADLSKEEFSRTHLGLFFDEGAGKHCDIIHYNKSSVKAPESFDWREKGVVTAVKDQGHCGSCWAFGAIGNVESQYAKVHGADKLINLSEQQLVDCDKSNDGCSGGFMTLAFVNLETSGVMSEADYPYDASNGRCKYDRNKVKVNVTGCRHFYITQEEDIKDILVNNGPLTLTLAGLPLHFYTGGVFKNCDKDALPNHALLLVGYGTDPNTNDPYWIIKNSWGKSFGEEGYLRIVRGNPDCIVGKLTLASAKVA